MDDGTDDGCGPDEVVRINPGYDARVTGDSPCVVVDSAIAPDYAKQTD
jgi:hypothetical protein